MRCFYCRTQGAATDESDMERFRNNSESPAKERAWESLVSDVERLRDSLGLHIDNEIKPLVVALRANGFSTTASCAGHVDHGLPYPWVDVVSHLAERLLSDRCYIALKQRAREARKAGTPMTESDEAEYENRVLAQIDANAKAQADLRRALDRFYASERQRDVDLVIDPGPWNRSRLRPAIAPSHGDPARLAASDLESGRAEMERFAEFLRRDFFTAN